MRFIRKLSDKLNNQSDKSEIQEGVVTQILGKNVYEVKIKGESTYISNVKSIQKGTSFYVGQKVLLSNSYGKNEKWHLLGSVNDGAVDMIEEEDILIMEDSQEPEDIFENKDLYVLHPYSKVWAEYSKYFIGYIDGIGGYFSPKIIYMENGENQGEVSPYSFDWGPYYLPVDVYLGFNLDNPYDLKKYIYIETIYSNSEDVEVSLSQITYNCYQYRHLRTSCEDPNATYYTLELTSPFGVYHFVVVKKSEEVYKELEKVNWNIKKLIDKQTPIIVDAYTREQIGGEFFVSSPLKIDFRLKRSLPFFRYVTSLYDKKTKIGIIPGDMDFIRLCKPDYYDFQGEYFRPDGGDIFNVQTVFGYGGFRGGKFLGLYLSYSDYLGSRQLYKYPNSDFYIDYFYLDEANPPDWKFEMKFLDISPKTVRINEKMWLEEGLKLEGDTEVYSLRFKFFVKMDKLFSPYSIEEIYGNEITKLITITFGKKVVDIDNTYPEDTVKWNTIYWGKGAHVAEEDTPIMWVLSKYKREDEDGGGFFFAQVKLDIDIEKDIINTNIINKTQKMIDFFEDKEWSKSEMYNDIPFKYLTFDPLTYLINYRYKNINGTWHLQFVTFTPGDESFHYFDFVLPNGYEPVYFYHGGHTSNEFYVTNHEADDNGEFPSETWCLNSQGQSVSCDLVEQAIEEGEPEKKRFFDVVRGLREFGYQSDDPHCG